jgi:hypothetical protein
LALAATTPYEIRLAIREAAERGDIGRSIELAALLRECAVEEISYVRAGWSVQGIPPMPDMINELELPEGRTEELQVNWLISHAAARSLEDGLTSTLAGALRTWQHFTDERALFLRLGVTPYMWGSRSSDLLLLEPFPALPLPTGVVVPFVSLSSDARDLLSFSNGIWSRSFATSDELAERSALSRECTEAALDELRIAGWAADMTLTDRLGLATVAQLKSLAIASGAKGAKKDDLIESIVDTARDVEVMDWLATAVPGAVKPGLISLRGQRSEAAGWWRHFCELLAHSLSFTSSSTTRSDAESCLRTIVPSVRDQLRVCRDVRFRRSILAVAASPPIQSKAGRRSANPDSQRRSWGMPYQAKHESLS